MKTNEISLLEIINTIDNATEYLLKSICELQKLKTDIKREIKEYGEYTQQE